MSADPLIAGDISPGRDPWLSNQAVATLLTGRFRDKMSAAVPDLRLLQVERFAFLAYPLSGGFQTWSLLPAAVAQPLLALEWHARHLLGRLAAFRLLAVYQRV